MIDVVKVVGLKKWLSEQEKFYIEAALKNRSHAAAARFLKLKRTTLVMKMKKLGMQLGTRSAKKVAE